MNPPAPHGDRPTDAVRLALVEREAVDLRRDVDSMRQMLAQVIGKIDHLCDELRPVVEYVSTQISEDQKDVESWRATVRRTKHDLMAWSVKVAIAAIATSLGIGWLIGVPGGH